MDTAGIDAGFKTPKHTAEHKNISESQITFQGIINNKKDEA